VASHAAPSLELLTGVAVAFLRSPFVTAATAWELQEATDGKFSLGLGTQVRTRVVRRYGTAFDRPGPRLRDYVVAVKACFSAFRTATLDHHGEFYDLDFMTPQWSPGPIAASDPKVDVAAVNPWMLRMAGEVANGVHVHRWASRAIWLVTSAECVCGRGEVGSAPSDIAVIVPVMTIVGDSDGERHNDRERVRASMSFYGSTPNYAISGMRPDSWGRPPVSVRSKPRAMLSRRGLRRTPRLPPSPMCSFRPRSNKLPGSPPDDRRSCSRRQRPTRPGRQDHPCRSRTRGCRFGRQRIRSGHHNRVAVGAVGQAEPLERTQRASVDAMATQPLDEGWTRQMDADPYPLCRWWWREGRMWRTNNLPITQGMQLPAESVLAQCIRSTKFTRQQEKEPRIMTNENSTEDKVQAHTLEEIATVTPEGTQPDDEPTRSRAHTSSDCAENRPATANGPMSPTTSPNLCTPSWSARQDHWPTRPTSHSLRTTSPAPTPWPPPSTTCWPQTASRLPAAGGRNRTGSLTRPRGVAWTLPRCCGNEPFRKKPWLTLSS
jgi:alkanesulfonate monooxygenase SsuD/methylene tetrahydromethanopterin reductase-like flavin-dependent oxidoreductase (luciferase family)